MSIFLAEFIGTMLLLIFGGGVVAGAVLQQSKAQGSGWLTINIGWGLGVAIAIYAVGKFSGAHLNPAVTLALASIGKIEWNVVMEYISGQFVGAFVGATIILWHYLPHFRSTDDQAAKLAVFATAPAIRSTFANLFSEIVGTFVLVFAVLAIGANQLADGLNPLLVGLLVVAIGNALGGTTGYAINPARDLAPRLVHFLLPVPNKGSSDWAYAWIPVVGACVGGVWAAQCYQAAFEGNISLTFWLFSGGVIAVAIAAFFEKN